MKWKSTSLLVGLAVLLFAFIFFIERRIPTGVQPLPRIVAFRANEVTNIQLRITNQLALRVEQPFVRQRGRGRSLLGVGAPPRLHLRQARTIERDHRRDCGARERELAAPQPRA